MYFSTLPIVTAPWPENSITQLPSHRRSCGQMRPQISGIVEVAFEELIGFAQAAFGGRRSQSGNMVVERAVRRAMRARRIASSAPPARRRRAPRSARRFRGNRARALRPSACPDRIVHAPQTGACVRKPCSIPFVEGRMAWLEKPCHGRISSCCLASSDCSGPTGARR